MAKVSIVIPLWTGDRTLPRALASIFAQSFTDCEVVIVYDGSLRAPPAVPAEYRERIRLVSEPNRGVSAARNAGIRASHSEYVAFLDDDDEWMPEKLARSVAVLDQDPECVLVYTGALKVDLAGTPLPNQNSQTGGIDSPTLAQMLERPWIIVPTQFTVRRAMLERWGGFDERLTDAEDMFFVLRAREHGHFRYVPDPLVRKYMHPLYPDALTRERGHKALVHAVRERYGATGARLVDEFRLNRMKLMKHMANMLIQEGRLNDARRCLARLIYYQPASPKAYRRYLKTFLPARTPRATASTEDSEA
jgi:glycosyltransferase involved in cell wall biosynthesis